MSMQKCELRMIRKTKPIHLKSKEILRSFIY